MIVFIVFFASRRLPTTCHLEAPTPLSEIVRYPEEDIFTGGNESTFLPYLFTPCRHGEQAVDDPVALIHLSGWLNSGCEPQIADVDIFLLGRRSIPP